MTFFFLRKVYVTQHVQKEKTDFVKMFLGCVLERKVKSWFVISCSHTEIGNSVLTVNDVVLHQEVQQLSDPWQHDTWEQNQFRRNYCKKKKKEGNKK